MDIQTQTFAPVAKLNIIRLLIALATKYHWKLNQLDVKSSFLNGELKEEVYLTQPEGFVEHGQDGEPSLSTYNFPQILLSLCALFFVILREVVTFLT